MKIWKRGRTALVTGSDYDNQTAQIYSTLRLVKEHHDKMLQAGFVWDGADTYAAPEGMTIEEFNTIIRQAP